MKHITMISNRESIKNQPANKVLKALYQTDIGNMCLKQLVKPGFSRAIGTVMDSRISALFVPYAVKKTGVDLGEYEKTKYKSYNDFFTRKIKKDERPIDKEPSHLISPCDAKLSAYTINADNKFLIKNSYYSVNELLQNQELAKEYYKGTCLIFRLCVDDYHRYCYIDCGKKGNNIFIPGELHTVQSIALDNNKNIYKRNSREYTVLDTVNFGKVVQVEVGALLIGRIKNADQSCHFHRGFEKGMFEFGGSTIVLLFKKDAVKIDTDIIENTKNNCETIVKMGEKIGESASK